MFKKFLKPFAGDPPRPQPIAPEREAQELIAQGNAAEDAGRIQEACALYQRAVDTAPRLPAAHLNLGIAQEALGQADAARASYTNVLALEDGHPFGAFNLAKLDYVHGRLQSAEDLLRRALVRKPDFHDAWLLLSNVLDARGDLEGAAEAIAQALRLKPDYVGALYNHAVILRRLGRIDEATAAAGRAAALDPENPDCLASYALLLVAQGFAAEALEPLQGAIQRAPHRFDLRSRELFLLNLREDVPAQDLWERHRALGAHVEASVPLRSRPARPASGRRLRLAFVSGDFRGHPVSMFLLPVLEGLTRERFEVFCYSGTTQQDSVTQRIRALSEHWIETAQWTDGQLADAIAADEIDILVDLSGHTSDVRLGAFAGKPAPLQLAWMGYLNTSGLTRMDYRLTDARCDPPSLSQPLHTERLLLLPNSQWCYRPFADVAAAATAPCERNGFVTFGSFNNIIKVTEAMALRWGRILKALPTARLLIADVASSAKKNALLAAIVEGGGDAQRVQFAARQGLEPYYQLLTEVDIALDSYPYGGGTTTFDALWMGTPVLTASGGTPASRSAASILAPLGLQRWIAADIGGYEALAIELANDTEAIAHLRRTLRSRLQASAFMDEATFVRDLEAALLRSWEERVGNA